MLKRLKQHVSQRNAANENQQAKREQFRNALVFLLLGGFCYGFYLYSATPTKSLVPIKKPDFDGVLDSGFNKLSDDAVFEKQQHQIDALKALITKNNTKALNKEKGASSEQQTLLTTMNKKIAALEQENKAMNEKLLVALAKQSQPLPMQKTAKPPTREELALRQTKTLQAEKAFYAKAGLETVHFNARRQQKEERTPENYVWAGTHVEGFLITGVKGDAGINGAKNMGTALIRLDSDGTMPNNRHSRLNGCEVIISTYGDLSDDAIVAHLETLSCAKPNLSFEKKVYGAVYDLDAMQDLRGTSILKTKPLLSYSTAAGFLAGFGDGLKNLNAAQTINPGAGTITTYGHASTLLHSAAGSAVSNPANRISDYIMKIADIYHPLVIGRGGRKVSVMFTKGFWIDRAHFNYESGKSLDNPEANTASATTTTITRAGESLGNSVSDSNPSALNKDDEAQFLQQNGLANESLFSPVKSKGASHG